MKHILVLSITVSLLLLGFSNAGALDMKGRLAVGVNAGIATPASGDFTSDDSFGDAFDLGPAFGVHINYVVSDLFSIQTGVNYNFMKMKDEVNNDMENEPHINVPGAYLDGIINFGKFIENPENRFNPYLKAGVGIYPWKVTENGTGGDAQVLDNDEDFSKTSFGINFGAGLEVFTTDKIAVFLEGTYNNIFTEDEDKFESGFSNLGNLEIKAGLSYYFPITNP